MFRYDVLCVGSATVDRVLQIEEPFSSVQPGDKILATSIELHSGGGATNAAAALAKLGLGVKVLAKVGKDHDGDFILQELKKYHVKNICLHRSEQSTDLSMVLSSEKEHDRIIVVHKGASEDLRETDIRKFDLRMRWLYVATLTGGSIQLAKDLVKYAHGKGIPVLFNPSLYLAKKGKNYLKDILEHTSILVLNKEEALAMLNTRKESVEDLLLALHHLGPGTVIITNGAKTLYAYDQNTIYFLHPPEVEIISTTGAGDAFTAGFLAGAIKKLTIEDSLCLGQVNASSVIQHIGAKTGLLTIKEAKARFGKYSLKVHRQELEK